VGRIKSFFETKGETLTSTTDKKGIAIFKNVSCGNLATVFSPNFSEYMDKAWQFSRKLDCSNQTINLGAFGSMSGSKLSKEDFGYINYGCGF